MKKSFVLSVAAVVLLLSAAGCGKSAPKKGAGVVPDFVNQAYLGASDDILIGVGVYDISGDLSKMSTGMTEAEKMALADIALQMALPPEEVKYARPVMAEVDNNGLLWVVMEFSKSAAGLDQEVSAAKLTVPAAAVFDVLDRMDAAFAKEAGGGPVPADE
jgi:hypothetical protein